MRFAALAVGALQLGSHAIEGFSQPAERFEAVFLHGHTHAEIAPGQGVGGCHDVGQGRGDLPEDPERKRASQ